MPKVLVNGINLYYEDHGSGFPLVFTHGFAATSAMWAPQIPDFSQKYRFIIVDMRGHGQSDAPEDPEQYSREILAEDVYHLLRHLGVQQAVIGGLSMGGIVTQAFYFQHPEMTRALILSNAAPGYRNMERMAEEDKSRLKTARILETEGMEGYIRAQEDNREMISVHLSSGVEDSSVPLEVLHRQNPIGLANVQRRVLCNLVMLPQEEIKVPTLIISSTRDIGLKPAAELMKRHIPGSLLCMIPNAGHGSNMDQPEIWNGIVLQWLAEQGI